MPKRANLASRARELDTKSPTILPDTEEITPLPSSPPKPKAATNKQLSIYLTQEELEKLESMATGGRKKSSVLVDFLREKGFFDQEG